ncbi:MAG: primosomal protein N' [Rhizomicrobium sp.]
MSRARVLVMNSALGPLDYRVPHGMTVEPGSIVIAPLGPRQLLGVVWEPEYMPSDAEVGDNRLRNLVGVVPVAPLAAPLRRLVEWTANYYLAPPASVARMAMPSSSALEGARTVTEYRATGMVPERMTPQREQALERIGVTQGLIRELAIIADVSDAVIRGLVKTGALEAVEVDIDSPFPVPDPEFGIPALSPDQRAAAEVLVANVDDEAFQPTLLDGVTGSGKTEVYFEAVAAAIRSGKQTLVLLPEIALTEPFLTRFAARFGCAPVAWHSGLRQSQRRRAWRAISSGQALVTVGARSSLFLPFPSLGLVIVDEEHEQAFKQQDGAIYHARDMAVVRARSENCPIILASATPSLESFVNATGGRYSHLKLASRHGVAEMPVVRIVDLRREKDADENGKWLSPSLRGAMEQTLAAGEQAMLFLNRRGYAPLTLCEACGHKLTCPNCSAWLVEHRYRKRLACHQCGYEIPAPTECPECKAQGTLIACGPGVERVAEEFAHFFPNARYAIASSDTLHGPAETQAAIRAFSKREIDVLIGTQIIAKGHHFPQLTLVGVIDADLGGADGDLRARERTFQLLHQVSGRAGRAEKPGLVLLQTRNPTDAVMQALVKGDRDGFYEQERMYRERVAAPPFGRLAAIVVSGYDGEQVREIARQLGKAAPSVKDIKVWGPTPAFYSLLRGQTRERLLVQATKGVDMQGYLRAWLAQLKIPTAVRATVDVDPISFF